MSTPFEKPVYITRPITPDMSSYIGHIEDIWASGIFTNGGRKHADLERRLSAYLQNYNLSLFNNATTALMVALKALDVSGECITTPFTFPATVHALSWNNIAPVFVDIDPATMNIDADKIEAAITPFTKAILGVHVFGVPCDVHKIQDIADKHGLKTIYDGAHAFGTEMNGCGIAAFGDATAFSFHATKLFHTAEGGALAVNSAAAKRHIDLLRNFGIQDEDTVSHIGINGKMSEIQAALGLCVMDAMEEELSKRAAIERVYRARLSKVHGIILPVSPAGVRPSMQYFVVRVVEDEFGRTRDEVHAGLKQHNAITRKYFSPLVSDALCYKQIPSAAPRLLPVAQRVAREVLALPFYGALGRDGAERVCDLIEDARRSAWT